jgi:hypothetical protein
MISQDEVVTRAEASAIALSGSIDDKVTYHPERYVEDIVDTVLNREENLRLIIKNYTLMDKGIDTMYVYETGTKEKVHFRHNAVDISLILQDSLIYTRTFTKESLPNIDFTGEFGRASLLHSIWMNEYNKQEGIITLFSTVCVPDTDWCNFYKIQIDQKGKLHIVLAEQT